MAKLDEHQSANGMKMMLLGNSGSGKTGALASLARAGYNLYIADFDNGADILKGLLADDPKEVRDRIDVETFTDKFKTIGSQAIPTKVEAWAKGIKQIEKWTNELEGPQNILVIDSLSLASQAAFNWILQVANRLGKQKEIQDWGAAQDLVGNFLQMMYSSDIKCSVIITAHIQYYGENDNDIKVGYAASAVGRSFSPKIARFFNNVLMVRTQGSGLSLKRDIVTVPESFVDLKNSAPQKVKRTYKIENGLAEFFADVLGERAPSVK